MTAEAERRTSSGRPRGSAPGGRERRPRWWLVASDVLAPIVLSVLAIHDLLYNGAGPIAWLLATLTVWPLVVRRRAPITTFGMCLAGLLGLVVTSSPPFAGFALLPALYTVAAHRTFRQAVIAAVVLEVVVLLVAPGAAPARSVDDTVVVLSALAIAALFLGTTVRSQRRYLATVEDRAERLEREQQQQVELAATQERTRIAREMHDIVAHGLAVMITLAEGAATRAETDPSTARSAMQQVADAGRQSLGEMRRLLAVLRPSEVAGRAPQPLLADLPALADDVRQTGLLVELEVDRRLAEAEPTVQATLYRAVQESLTNVMKHADGAASVRVSLARELEDGHAVVAFSVVDDGRRQAGRAPSGSGLRGMTERFEMFDGWLAAGYGPTGWAVRGGLAEGRVEHGLGARRR